MLKKMFIIIFVLCVCPLGVLAGQGNQIRLHTGNFDPSLGNSQEIFQALSNENNETGEEKYYILQFTGPVEESWKTQVMNRGAKLFSYVPDFAFIARISPNKLASLYGLACVRAVTELSSDAKISPAVHEKIVESTVTGCELIVRIFEDEDVNSIIAKVTGLGGVVSGLNFVGESAYFSVKILEEKIFDLSEIDGVRWIDVPAVITPNNDSSGKITGARSVWSYYGYYGEGQIVAVLDSGLCGGDINDLHPDFSDGKGGTRVTALVAAPYNKSGVVNTDGRHGTHVAATVLGNGIQSGADPANSLFPESCYAGMAPKASLVFQVSGSAHTGCSAEDFVATFEQARNLNARISTNSLQFDSFTNALLLDEYLWDHKDFLAITAIGNAGQDYNFDGIIDLGSIGADSGGKNIITVGASETVRQSEAMIWPKLYNPNGNTWLLADPLKSDRIANCTMGVAAFSARGPTNDDRYKPDVLTPASNVISATHTGWDTEPYVAIAGTSMAAPQVAGAAALIREYLEEVKGISSPSAALMKAILVNSAKNMGVGQYGNGQFREILSVPNDVCGWGLLNLREAISPQLPFTVVYYDEKTVPLTTGESKSYSFSVSDSGLPLKAHLVWTDQAGSEPALGKLVNDLDLSLISPSNKIYYPNNARLHRTSSSFFTAPADGGSESIGLFQSIYAQLPEFPSSSLGISKVKAYLAKPLTVKTAFTASIAELHENGTMLILKGSPKDFAAGESELEFTTSFVLPKDSGRTKFLRLSCAGNGVEYKTASGYSANKIRYLEKMVPNPSGGMMNAIETTTKKPFQADIETFEIPLSPDFDRVNNVVGVLVDKPETGTWMLKIKGYNVPDGPQPYALVVSGLSGEISEGVQPIATKPAFVPDSVVTEKKSIHLDQTDLESQYHLSDSKPLADKFDATMTIAPGAGQQSLASFCYTVDGVDGQKVSSLNLIKLKDDDTTLEFSYSENAVFSDGHWWLSDLAGNVLGLTEFMNFEELYRVNIVVLDNGNFDLNADENIVRDPSVLTTSSSSSSATSTDSGSSGCVMNPDSSAKIDWILFALVIFISLLRLGRSFFRKGK